MIDLFGRNRPTVVVVVGGGRLDEEKIFFQVVPAEKLASSDDKLVTFLQWPAANEAAEAGQVERQRRAGSHDQFVRV